MDGISVVVIPAPAAPWWVRWLGLRYDRGDGDYRMAWGELSWSRTWRLALALCLFGDRPHFSFNIDVGPLHLFIDLPFLRRFAWQPRDMMEAWGLMTLDGAVHLNWGPHTKILTFPWADWRHVSHEVRRPDGSWVPFVGSWETWQEGMAPRQWNGQPWKEPDGRAVETYPYHYLTDQGEAQHVTATVHVERRTWRLRWLPFIKKVRHSISVEFSGEVGERVGSWKGGCVGCGYDLRPNETPRECLRRMQRERRFD
jgi:hypothetical protein